METISSWENADTLDENLLSKWTEDGVAFPLDPQGTRSIHISEKRQSRVPSARRKPNFLKYAAEVYVSAGTKAEPLFVKASRLSALKDLAIGSVDKDELLRRGEAFTNLSKLFADETLVNRADNIATRLNNEFAITSPEWKRWVNRTAAYNATSLAQVAAAYFQEESIGDVGGSGADYTPRRGYPGTLAPGEKFKDNFPVDSLPRRILHPWPAMQSFQFHVRWPPSHPMIPPPLLWIGLNNMYTSNFTEWQLSLPADDNVVGGTMMEAKDAIRIAKYAKFGLSYNPAEQLKHGGMVFEGGYDIPYYNPDHPATVPAEEARPPIPKELLPVTERWLDPFFGMQAPEPRTDTELAQLADEEFEENIRKQAADRLLSMLPKTQWQGNIEEEGRKAEEEELARLLELREQTRLRQSDDADDDLKTKYDDSEESQMLLEADKMQARRDVAAARRIAEGVSGKARTTREIISYTIQTIREMDDEIYRAERDIVTKKKAGRRRQRKRPAESSRPAFGSPRQRAEGFEETE